jgi:hypothetical protein
MHILVAHLARRPLSIQGRQKQMEAFCKGPGASPVRPNSRVASDSSLPTRALDRRWPSMSMGPEGGTPTRQRPVRPG